MADNHRVTRPRRNRPGHRMTELWLSNGNGFEKFRVHQELLASSSIYFCGILQPNRKAISGDCNICAEPLDPVAEFVTYCALGCSTNMHNRCLKAKQEYKESQDEICPVCQAVWVKDDQLDHVPECSHLDAKVFHIYVDWLYSEHIAVLESNPDNPPTEGGDATVGDVALAKAFLMGIEIEDDTFCEAILQAFAERFKDFKSLPSSECIRVIYAAGPTALRLRQFIVELCAARVEDRGMDLFEQFNLSILEYSNDLVYALTHRLAGTNIHGTAVDEVVERFLPAAQNQTWEQIDRAVSEVGS